MKNGIIFLSMLFTLLFCKVCFADEISEYYDTFNMNTLDEYGDFKTVFKKTVQGDMSYIKTLTDPKKLFLSELVQCMDIMKGLLMICMLNGLVSALDLGKGSGTEYMTFMTGRLLAAGLCLKAIKSVLLIMIGFSDMFLGLVGKAVPITAAVLAVSGRVSLGSGSAVLMYTACTAIAALIKKIIIPCIGFYAVCGLINCVSPHGMLTRLANLIHSFITIGMKIFGIAFGFVLSFERAVTAASDGLIQKSAVAAAKAVPVVGDVFASGAESVIALTSSLKSGFSGALIVFMAAGCVVPLIKVFAVFIIFKLAAALSEPLGDKGISDMIDASGNVCGLVFSVMFGMALIFVGAAALLMFDMGG